MIKFTNYILSRKHAHQLRNAAAILTVARTLTGSGNTFHVPIAVSLSSSVSVSDKNPNVQVRGVGVVR